MKTKHLFAIALPALLALNACQTTEQTGTLYGEELTLKEATSVSAILADPDTYAGERVLVTGNVVGVCEHKGDWIDIAGELESEKIRVKVDAGVIVFPLTATGHVAAAEGIVEHLTLSIEELIEQGKHHAEETGQEFDPSSVTAPRTILQIRGLGARIEQ